MMRYFLKFLMFFYLENIGKKLLLNGKHNQGSTIRWTWYLFIFSPKITSLFSNSQTIHTLGLALRQAFKLNKRRKLGRENVAFRSQNIQVFI